jgi:rhodanese-related sulfurtransferase
MMSFMETPAMADASVSLVRTYAGDVSSTEAWRRLAAEPRAKLIDVRTQAEWLYVGVPDLSALGKQPVLVAWQLFPTMLRNDAFAAQLQGHGIEPDDVLLFLCRSGVRSRAAAEAMTALGHPQCYNVADGFEGPPDAARHRGGIGGWKVAGLPWIQA